MMQVPEVQLSHVPVHAELQHNPSAQKPDWQSAFIWHVVASGAVGTHVPS